MADAQLRPPLPAVNILALNLAGCLSPARARGSTSSAGQVWPEPMGFATRLVRTSISSRQCAIVDTMRSRACRSTSSAGGTSCATRCCGDFLAAGQARTLVATRSSSRHLPLARPGQRIVDSVLTRDYQVRRASRSAGLVVVVSTWFLHLYRSSTRGCGRRESGRQPPSAWRRRASVRSLLRTCARCSTSRLGCFARGIVGGARCWSRPQQARVQAVVCRRPMPHPSPRHVRGADQLGRRSNGGAAALAYRSVLPRRHGDRDADRSHMGCIGAASAAL